jgi:hypothetical protein
VDELISPVQLHDIPKARRLSTEFFGQWLGFYHFDQFRGVDTARFPEFTDEIKSSMYDEAVSFFEHVIRKDRPVREILFADYGFLNQPLAKFYAVKKEIKSAGPVELVTDAGSFQRRNNSVASVTVNDWNIVKYSDFANPATSASPRPV